VAPFGVLVATAIALQFEHVGQTIGWLGLGLAAVEMGRRLPSRGVTIFGLIVGGVATVGVAARPALDAFGGSTLLRPLFDVIGFDISTWALLAIANVIAMHAAALRLPATDGWRTVRVVLVALASMMWMGMCMHQSEGLVTTGAWLLYAVVLIALARFDFVRSVPWLQTGVVALAFTAGRWLVINALVGRADPNWRAGQMLAFVNWQMGLAIAIAGVGWWSCRLLARHERDRLVATQGAAQASTGGMLWQVALIVGAAFTLVAICFEIDRGVAQASLRAPMHVRQLLFTLAWAAGSVIVAIMARTLVAGLDGQAAISRTWLLRRFAWSVLAICAVKWVAWDAPWLLLTDRRVFHDLTPLLNLQMIVGLGLAGALALLPMVLCRAQIDERSEQHAGSLLDLPRDLASWMPVAACCIVLWGLSFEVDRLLTQAVPLPRWLSPFEPLQVRALWWTALWICGGVIMFLIGQARRQSGLIASAIVIAAISTIVWLAFDTLLPRLATGRPAAVTPIFNLQFAVGVLCAVNLMMIAGKVRGLPAPHATAPGALDPRALSRVLIAGVGIIGLWLGSIEVDRIFDNDPMVRQAALSVWWALYAVGLVVLGFAQRLALVRYAGLALLSLAAVKVLIVDLASLDQLPRVLSFAAAGLLLIMTSVVYARLSPRLLREHEGGASRHDPP
jgi:hypothetical protein